jgi:hypothetical protein
LLVTLYCRERSANCSGSGFEIEMRADETASAGSWELPAVSGDGKVSALLRATVGTRRLVGAFDERDVTACPYGQLNSKQG